ncbi:MAG: glutamate 5-kinase [Candidatus Marinimicrobia bacterium]|nr:glutamate 5-kinase [Candidatus Neomarinimicrobiota bacterium]
MMRNSLEKPARQRIVIKIGSHVLTKNGAFTAERVERLAEQIMALVHAGNELLLITSGAVLMGKSMLNLQLSFYPRHLKQSLAAIGQVDLISEYAKIFSKLDQPIAQILINLEDFQHHHRYLNIKETIQGLFKLGVLPILNENDTIYTEDMSFGDNDSLAAQVASMLDANLLVILSTVDGLYDGHPNDASSSIIPEVAAITDKMISDAHAKGQLLSTGGMRAKLQAIRTTNHVGVPVVLANGTSPGILNKIFEGQPVGTLFYPEAKRMPLKKRWIAYSANTKGTIIIDEGARRAIMGHKASLLSSGVTGIEGEFDAQDPVVISTIKGAIIARGITNYGWQDLNAIAGLSSDESAKTLGSNFFNEVVHREQLVLLPQKAEES